jgi:uncharacterized SAM-binding protein YcdF (DUF218 family)
MAYRRRNDKPAKRDFNTLALITLALTTAALVLIGVIATRLTLARRQQPRPQAILILDGSDARVRFGATFARLRPDLPMWISGDCSGRPAVHQAFNAAGLAPGRVHYDLLATDTVTHFTVLAGDYAQREIRHVYLVTSDYHMTRARIIAALAFGSRGIAVTPVAEPSDYWNEESWWKNGRDAARSLLWLGTGLTGARFNPRLQNGERCRW